MKQSEYADRIAATDSSMLAELFMASSDPKNISFAGGYPDQTLFPDQALQAAFTKAIQAGAPGIYQYTDAKGPLNLRNILAQRHTARTNVASTADDILITQGGQQAIDLIARLFLNKHSGLGVEAPTYMGAISAFNTYEPTYFEIPLESDGLDVAYLEQQLKSHRGANRIRLMYVIPDFQNPTGVTLSILKRQRLAQLAREYDFYILEDSPYRDLRYSGEDLPTIQSFDTDGRVLYVSSFSKILSPGLRVGYIQAAPELITELAGLKSSADVQSPNMTLEALATFLTENKIDDHINQMKPVYAAKRDAMINALHEYLPATITFTKPDGGFFLWLQAPQNVNLLKFLKDVLMPEANIVYVPGQPQFATSISMNTARLNFSNVPLENIEPAVKRMAALLNKYL